MDNPVLEPTPREEAIAEKAGKFGFYDYNNPYVYYDNGVQALNESEAFVFRYYIKTASARTAYGFGSNRRMVTASVASSKTIADDLHLSVRHVRRIKKKLLTNNLIRFSKEYGKKYIEIVGRDEVEELIKRTEAKVKARKSLSKSDKKKTWFDFNAMDQLDLSPKAYAIMQLISNNLKDTNNSHSTVKVNSVRYKLFRMSASAIAEKINSDRWAVMVILKKLAKKGIIDYSKTYEADGKADKIRNVYMKIRWDKKEAYYVDDLNQVQTSQQFDDTSPYWEIVSSREEYLQPQDKHANDNNFFKKHKLNQELQKQFVEAYKHDSIGTNGHTNYAYRFKQEWSFDTYDLYDEYRQLQA